MSENVAAMLEEPSTKKKRLEPPTASSSSSPPCKSSPNQRQFHQIPIFIVDYHNDVMNFIYRCFASRHVPLQDNMLIHFDSHPDMVISHHIKPATVYDKDQLLDQLSIENWIMPACYAGHFRQIVWLKNSWCNQIPEGIHDFQIGDYDDEIRVDLPVDYFVSEGNYCDTKLLNNAKRMNLTVINSDKMPEELKIEATESRTVILDIDLDFFSVTNPFLELYKKADLYTKLQKIFAYDETGSPEEVTLRRRNQLKQLEEVFCHLDVERDLDDFENDEIPEDRFALIHELVDSVTANYGDEEIDWILINDAGNTSDHNGLPHHVSTEEELEVYFSNFEKFLRETKVVPNIVTMARSSEDDYCPKIQVDSIQERVVGILKKMYGDRIAATPISAYVGEEWDVMKL